MVYHQYYAYMLINRNILPKEIATTRICPGWFTKLKIKYKSELPSKRCVIN